MASSFARLVLALSIQVDAGPTVKIGHTTLNGRSLPHLGVDFFGGLPFAKPPVGDLRFAPPQLVTTFDGPTFDATQVSVACIQNLNSATPPAPDQSEDCLYLDIYRPSGISTHAKLPVMMWIYGGGFIDGDSGLYNGSTLVSHSISRGTPIVFAALNYRLGALGFPAGQDAARHGALNLGLKDQLTALQWLQVNIGHFGGDKEKVTIFGESAGAISIADLFLNSKLETLARGAILESGSQSTTNFFTPEQENALWNAFIANVPSCAHVSQAKTFACLRAAPVLELVHAANSTNAESPGRTAFRPVIDGPNGVIPDLPSRLLAKGHFARIPFISGTNLDEGTAFTTPSVSSKAIIVDLLVNASNSVANGQTGLPHKLIAFETKLVDMYSTNPADGSPFGTGDETFGLNPLYKLAAAVIGDLDFQALRRAFLGAAASNGVRTFGYEFSDAQPGSGALGVFHSSEIKYIYGSFADDVPPPSSTGLSKAMMDYWISFATSLDPNDGHGRSRPSWPQYHTSHPQIIQLKSQNLTAIPDDFRKTQMDFINQRENAEILRH